MNTSQLNYLKPFLINKTSQISIFAVFRVQWKIKSSLCNFPVLVKLRYQTLKVRKICLLSFHFQTLQKQRWTKKKNKQTRTKCNRKYLGPNIANDNKTQFLSIKIVVEFVKQPWFLDNKINFNYKKKLKQ